MEFVTRMVSVFHAPTAFLSVFKVLSPPHLLTNAGATTGLAQTNGAIRGDGGVLYL